MASLGYEPQPVADNHLCCGSAGAYSLLQPAMAGTLKTAKLKALNASSPAAIYTANIGCWMHLAQGGQAPGAALDRGGGRGGLGLVSTHLGPLKGPLPGVRLLDTLRQRRFQSVDARNR